MRTAIRLAVLGACALFGSSAFAEATSKLSYTMIDLSYGHLDYDDLDLGAEGFTIDGSLDIGNNIFVYGAYTTVKTDDFGSPVFQAHVKNTGYSVGVGYYHPLNATVDLVSSVSFMDAKSEPKGDLAQLLSAEEDTGWSAGASLRALVMPQLEISGGARYSKLFDDSQTVLGVGAVWYPFARLGLGVNYSVSSDSKSLGGTLRIPF